MKILVISNLYPPHYVGGYELGCGDIVDGLKTRGYDLRVLTSTYGVGSARTEQGIYRWLCASFERTPAWHAVVQKEIINQIAFKQVCADFWPDVVFLWNLSHISVSIAFLAQRMGLPTCYCISDNWLATWEMDHWYQLCRKQEDFKLVGWLCRVLDLTLPQQSLDLTRVIFTSRHLKDTALEVGKLVAEASVVHWGVDLHRFPYKVATAQEPSRILYVGQVQPHKGVHVAIQALSVLRREYGRSLSLSIVGDSADDTGSETAYVSYLREVMNKCGVGEYVRFMGRISRNELPALYHAHDTFILPSVWNEPFSIALLEAMSCGLPVVSTVTGGSAELLQHDFNALTFPKENEKACADQILRLLRDPALAESIRSNARKTIEQGFRLEQKIDMIETALAEVAEARTEARAPLGSPRPPIVGATFSTDSFTRHTRRIQQQLRVAKLAYYIRRSRRFLSPKAWVRRLSHGYYMFLASVTHLSAGTVSHLFPPAHFRHRMSPLDLSQIRSVLVTQLADLGDVVLTSAFLRELRRLLPSAWIGLIVQPSMYNLVEKCPYVNRVYAFDWRAVRGWRHSSRGYARWWLLGARFAARHLWQHRIEMAISCRWNEDSCQTASLILMRASGARWRIGYMNEFNHHCNAVDAHQNSHEIWDHVRERARHSLLTDGPVRRFPKHEVERQLDILRFLGACVSDTNLELWTSPADEEFATHMLRAHGMKNEDVIVAFSPGANWPQRRWPVERFIELGSWLQQRYLAHVLIIGSQCDQEIGLRIENSLQPQRTLNLVGRTSLRQLAAVLRHCSLFVGNDSGPMHMAAAAGVPVIALFGPGEHQRFKPLGANHDVARLELLCSPCRESCLFVRPYCMEGLKADQVKRIISTSHEFLRVVNQVMAS